MSQRAQQSEARLSMEERREAILQAAIHEFAVRGLYGASTEAIAARVGISQPYIFKIFGTKKELFLAAVERIYDNTLAAFRAGLVRNDLHPLEAMGRAFEETVTNRNELLVLLQSTVATADDDVKTAVRAHLQRIYSFVRDHAQVGDEQVQQFLGYGLMIAAMRSIDFQPPLKDG